MSRTPAKMIVRRKWTRRDLFKAAPVAAVGAGALGLALTGRTGAPVEQNKGTCRYCLMHCGVVATVQGERLVKVEGDLASRTRGFVCEHGYALREQVHSHGRLGHPLVRRGDELHEVSWDDALGEIARRLEQVKQRFGPQALAIQTGWPLVRHPLVNFLHRFARAYGSPNVASVASLCEASLRMGQALTVGTKYAPDVRALKTLVVWGANPPTTAPPFAHVVAAKALNGNLIVIDPVRTTLAKEATVYLSPRAGTDGALALGLMHVIVRERLFDADFVARHTVGFEGLEALAAEYPPERVEALTSVKAADVEKVARLISADKPMGVWQGLGVEHHESGVQTVRAISSLEVLCGRFDGTHDSKSLVTALGPRFKEEMLPALYRMRTPEPVPPPVTAAALGRERFPLYEIYNREAQGEVYVDAILDDQPYPLRAMILWASNALVTASGTARLQKAADKLELLVTVDPYLSDSGKLSDVVLPASTFAESQDIDADDEHVAAKGLVPPQPGSLPDFTILTKLAQAMGLRQYFPWRSFQEAMNARHVTWMVDDAVQPRPEVADGTEARFGTVTGKAEFASTLLERAGQEPLPKWTAPTEGLTPDFPLRLVSGPRPRARINSQFAQSPSVTARMREPELLIHPDAATKAGVTHGTRVAVVSPHGRIEIRAVVTRDVHPECVVMPAGWGQSNPNWLISDEKRDPISGFPAFRSGACRVEPLSTS
ncbi:MAG: molybdopterin oxidoreductase [Myxococcaceae bacterium]